MPDAMLPRFRSIAAVLALAAILGGGLVAPTVHRAMHGLEHAAASSAAAAQTDHVHTDGLGFTVSLGAHAVHVPCLLCVSPHAAPPVLAAPALASAPSLLVQARVIAPATAVLALLPIRGPPAVA